MTTRTRRDFLLVSALLALAPRSAGFARASSLSETEATVVQLVETVSDSIATHGLEQARTDSPANFWFQTKDRLYIYVIDTKGSMLHHPQGAVIGSNILNTRDLHGKPFIQDIIASLPAPGDTAWVEYLWADPVSGQVRTKRVYAKRVGDLIICCGYYFDSA